MSQLAARERTFTAALVEIERLAGGRGRLLDIGTAAGAFVAAAVRRGWDAEGCEPNRWLGEWGARHYGIRIRQGSVFVQDYAPASFDVVTLWDVIEHTPDPRAVLDRCRELLKPGGLLIVNYPDIGSWIARALGRRWLFLTSVHLWYFDRTTIRRLMESGGFDVAGDPSALPTARAGLHPAAGLRVERRAVEGRTRGDPSVRRRPRASAVLAGPDVRRSEAPAVAGALRVAYRSALPSVSGRGVCSATRCGRSHRRCSRIRRRCDRPVRRGRRSAGSACSCHSVHGMPML